LGYPEILSVIATIVLMIAVFAAAYFVSKYIGKHYKPNAGSSKHLSVIENAVVGKDRSLLIVKVGEKAFLIGSTPAQFTLLSEVDAAQYKAEDSNAAPAPKDFISTFRDVIKSKIK
jgi:flagellar protein FliO/FliZ